ncbi:MAG: hypothetical protein ABIE43_00215 [Patescibacteria group bacterium]
MIEKNTKIIFKNGEQIKSEEFIGGIPLSKGEVVQIHKENSEKIIDYKVVDKVIDYFLNKKGNQIMNITYTLKKK